MSDERMDDVTGSLPDPAADPTAALLRDVLARQADAVRPSADGLARIRAAVETGSAPARKERPARRLALLPRRAERPAAAVDGPAGRATGDTTGDTAEIGVAPATEPQRHRSWATAVAAAAAVVLLAGAAGYALDRLPVLGGGPGPAGKGGDSTTLTTTAPALPVYVVGSITDDTGRTRYGLYREYRPTYLANVDQRLSTALTEAVARPAYDADYTRVFGAAGASQVRARWNASAGEVQVQLTQAMVTVRGASDARANIAIQQLVWTATAVVGKPDVPVRISVAGASSDQHMLGRPAFALGGRFQRGHGTLDPLAPVWLVDPAEATTLPRRTETFAVSVGFGGRGGVDWVLTRNAEVVDSGRVTVGFAGGRAAAAPGSRGVARITVDHTLPGDYVLTAYLPKSLPGPHWADSKSFIVN